MKKILCLTLCLCLLAALMAGCSRGNSDDTTGNTTGSTQDTAPSTEPATEPSTEPSQEVNTELTESVSILTKIWDAFGEDQRFAVYGGAAENAVDGAPGALDLGNTDEVVNRYLLPAQHLEKVTEAASLVHMMNSNIFTGVVFRFADAADVETVAEDLYQNVLDTHWICGSPDRAIIAAIGEDTLVMAYGIAQNMTVFHEKLTDIFPDATILQDISIAE